MEVKGDDSYEGIVKQQTQHAGLFEWTRKAMRLHKYHSTIEMVPAGEGAATFDMAYTATATDLIQKFSLLEAKYAKEWTFTSSLAGCGFDLAWTSGDIWSFIVADETLCKSWVSSLNQAITIASKDKQSSAGSSTQNTLEFCTDPLYLPIGSIGENPPPVPPPYMTSNIRASSDFTAEENKENVHSSTNNTKSAYSSSSSSSSSSGSSSTSGYIQRNYIATEQEKMAKKADIKSKEKENRLMFELKRNYLLLEQKYDGKVVELQSSQNLLEGLKKELEERTSALEMKLESAWEKERRLRLDSQTEIESRVVRATNENNSFYEASAQAVKMQHQRELSCLRDELHAERKRYSALLEKESSYRLAAEGIDAQQRNELATLKDMVNNMEIEHQQYKHGKESKLASMDRAHRLHVTEFDSKYDALRQEKEAVVRSAQHELYNRMGELKKNYESSLKDVHQKDVNIAVQEVEGEKLRAIAEMQKQCMQDLEQVRNEERRVHAMEFEKLRKTFRSKEHKTIEDLIKLEKLHDKRTAELQHKLLVEQDKNDKLVEQLRDAQEEAVKGSASVRDAAAEYKQQMKQHIAQGKQLAESMRRMDQELLESRVKEGTYRDQLAQSIEHSRVHTAELYEAKQQAAVSFAQAQQWREAATATEVALRESDQGKEITRDEVLMLENEMRRVRNENIALREDLMRADRMIYGVAQHEGSVMPNTIRVELSERAKEGGSVQKSSERRVKRGTRSSSAGRPQAHTRYYADDAPSSGTSDSGSLRINLDRSYLSTTSGSLSRNRKQMAEALQKKQQKQHFSGSGSVRKSETYATPIPLYSSSLSTYAALNRTRQII